MENNDQNNNTSNPSSSSGGFLDPSEWEKWGNDFLKEALMGLDNNNMNTMNYDQFDPSLMINNPHPQQTNQLPQQQQEQPLLLDFGNLHGLTMNNPYMDFPWFVSPTSNPNSNPNVPNYNVISNVPNVPVAPSPMVLPEDYQYHQQFQPQQAQATPVEDEESQILSMFWRQQLLDIQNLEGKGNALPIARVKKIMKSDKNVKMMISSESPVVLAKASEIFIKELGLRAWLSAQHNKRRTIHRDDVTSSIAHHDVFDFLHEFFQIKPNPQQQSHDHQPHPHASSSAGITSTTTTSVTPPPSSTTINMNPGIHINQQQQQQQLSQPTPLVMQPPLSQPPFVMQPPFPPSSSSSSSQFPYYFPPNN